MSDDTTPSWMPPSQTPAGPPPPSTGQAPAGPIPALPPQLPVTAPNPVPPPPPGAAPPFGAGPYTAPMIATPMLTSPGDEASNGRSKKVLVGAVVGVLALGSAGVFAATQLTADNSGGADSPEALGEAVMLSLENEDALGVIDLLLPGERETFRGPVTELVSELTRLEVLSDDASLSGLSGFDVVLADRSVQVNPTNVDDITNITMTASASVNVDGVDLPIGKLITDNFGDDFDIAELDATQTDLPFELPVTAVQRDGRWYLSGMYTIAENARVAGGFEEIPASGIEAKGGDSPEGAIDVVLDGVEQLDLSAVIGAINPNEAEALQRYAPLFLDEAQQELDNAPLSWQVTDATYDVSGSGSKRSVDVTSLRVDGEYKELETDTGSIPFSVTLKDGCAVIESQGESTDTCDLQSGAADLGDVFYGTDGLDEIRAEFADIFADYEQPGITVNEVGGQWYVSPIGTGFDQLFALMRAVDRDEIERAGDAFSKFFDSAGGLFGDSMFGDDFSLDEPTDTLPEFPGDTIPEDVFPTDSVPGEGDPEIAEEDRLYEECLAGSSAAEVATCLQTNIDAGLIPDYYMPTELAHLECGVGDVFLSVTPNYEMSDEEYTAILTAANTCFAQLITDGVLTESDVPPEYLRPECAEGRNPWNFDAADNDELFDRWLDCIYA